MPIDVASLRGWAGSIVRPAAVAVVSLAAATASIAVLQGIVRIPTAAPVYLLAVLVVAVIGGTFPAILTAAASFLLYDFLFTQPVYTLTVSDPNQWLDLLLYLAVALVIGRLVALQAEHAAEAARRAREAQSLFRISRALATSDDLAEAARDVLAELVRSTQADRIWLALGASPAEEVVLADTVAGTPRPTSPWVVVLQRTPGDEPARWTRMHVGGQAERRSRDPRHPTDSTIHRIRIEVPGLVLGSLWIVGRPAGRDPDRVDTRIVSAAADQLGQSVRRDALAREALEAEVAQRSDKLKTALLDSVSHDLRTPLAAIRAAAGTLLDSSVRWSDSERRAALRSIDLEAERMNRLVRNLLDLSRIEGGGLRPELAPHDVDELVTAAVRRQGTERPITVDLPADLPPVLVDDTYVDEILANLLENAIRHGGSTIRLVAAAVGDSVEIVVEDDGGGVPDGDLARLFDKFYRVRRPAEGSRPGMGIGLTVANGLTRAMGGTLEASRSPLGGLAVRLRLPAAAVPAEADGDGEADREDEPAAVRPASADPTAATANRS